MFFLYVQGSVHGYNEWTYIHSFTEDEVFEKSVYWNILLREDFSSRYKQQNTVGCWFFWSRGFPFFLNAAMFGWETPSLSAILALLRVSKTASFETMRHLIIRVDTSAQFCNIGSAVEIILRCCTPGRFLWQCTKFVTSGIHKTI